MRGSRSPCRIKKFSETPLEAERPGKALPLLKQLTKTASPKPHWLVALSNTLKALKKKEETARAMEQAAGISGDPDLYYHAAYLWLEANRPKKALLLLEKLAKRKRPQVEWLLALANTYIMLDQIKAAAVTMDRVVRLEPKPDYFYNAGVLWVQAEQPRKALHHLTPLCKRSPAKAEWFVALAHAWLGRKEVVKAARAMEQAAALGGKPEHAYQAGLLWLQAKQADGALRVLVPLSKQPRPRAQWLVALSNAWVLKENRGNAAGAMEQAAHISGKPDHFYSAAGLWLQAERPRKALPLLQGLAKKPKPEAKWLALLSETWLRLENVPQAAEAMERAAKISRKDKHTFRASRLWLEADRPHRALPLLEGLAQRPSPLGEWYIALSNCNLMLEKPEKAARAMERAAEITQKGED
jgi:predicted Zn-dependent protease